MKKIYPYKEFYNEVKSGTWNDDTNAVTLYDKDGNVVDMYPTRTLIELAIKNRNEWLKHEEVMKE